MLPAEKTTALNYNSAWEISDYFDVDASLGLLKTQFDDFLTFEHLAADRDNGIPINLRGREQAQSPALSG